MEWRKNVLQSSGPWSYLGLGKVATLLGAQGFHSFFLSLFCVIIMKSLIDE